VHGHFADQPTPDRPTQEVRNMPGGMAWHAVRAGRHGLGQFQLHRAGHDPPAWSTLILLNFANWGLSRAITA